MKKIILILLICAAASTVDAAQQNRYAYNQDNSATLRDIQDRVDALRHEIENHETEIKMFQERVDNQESTVSSLRQQILDTNQANKELVKGNTTNVDGRIAALETANKGFIADLQKFKTHANDSSTALAQQKERIAELEKIITAQNQNIERLQSAVRLMTEALQVQVKDTSVAEVGGDKIYKVKPGDSLEKIARAHGTSTKALKDANNLSSDRIVVGQSLQLP